MKTASEAQFTSVLEELTVALSIPNNASYPGHVAANISWCRSAFTKRGFEVNAYETGGPQILIATRLAKKAKKTILIYLQIDGQPVDSSKWFQDSPYIPVLKSQDGLGNWKVEESQTAINDDWRIFARSASDAKGPVAMFLGAMDIINANKYKPSFNIKIIMDFEEELGSPHLPDAVKKYATELAADGLIIMDGPRHQSNMPTLTFGARGISTVKLVVFGPRVPQHSGHYGNYAPNPAFGLAKILASLKDDDGRVTIPGYYEGVTLGQEELEILAQVPDDEIEIKKKLGISKIDNVGANYQQSIQYPSLNVRGMQSGWIDDEVRTIIPGTATAEIDIRLVPESNAPKLVNSLKDHIADMDYHFVDGTPSEEERSKYKRMISFTYEHSYDAFRTPFDSDLGVALTSALERAFGTKPIRKRISGGSIPISPFVTTLGIPAVTVPTVNSDNNQHSPNENLRLGNIKEGTRTFLSILTQDF